MYFWVFAAVCMFEYMYFALQALSVMSVAALVSVRVVPATVCVTYRLRSVPVMSTGLALNVTLGTAQAHLTAPAEVSLAFVPSGLAKSTHQLIISSRISCRMSINLKPCFIFIYCFHNNFLCLSVLL